MPALGPDGSDTLAASEGQMYLALLKVQLSTGPTIMMGKMKMVIRTIPVKYVYSGQSKKTGDSPTSNN